MSAPTTAPQPVRLCSKDGFALELDREIARACIEAGWPAVELYACRNGHSLRLWPDVQPPRVLALLHPCGVCGLALPRVHASGSSGGRKYHQGQCTRVADAARARFLRATPDAIFIPEAQPWWRGYLTPLSPPLVSLPPLDPLAGRMPRDWADGWRRVHGLGAAEEAA